MRLQGTQATDDIYLLTRPLNNKMPGGKYFSLSISNNLNLYNKMYSNITNL